MKSHRLKDFILKLVMLASFTLGALIFSYPFISNIINNYYDQIIIKDYTREFNKKSALERNKLSEEMILRNEEILANNNFASLGIVDDPFSDVNSIDQNYGNEYYQEHLLGAIYIPKINVSLPVFDETNNALLEKGATLLQGTSYPIGDQTKHSVITSHAGLPNKKLFTDLTKVDYEDIFYIEVNDEIMAYEVFEIKVVLPEDIDSIKIRAEKDIVTLLTCTPYMINSHRLLVSGERVEYKPEDKEVIETIKNYHSKRLGYIALIILVLISVLFIRLFFIKRRVLLKFSIKDLEYQDGDKFSLYNKDKHLLDEALSEESIVDFSYVKKDDYYIKSSFDNDYKIIAKVVRGKFEVYYLISEDKRIRIDVK